MNDSRFLKIVIIILLLLNSGTMVFIWTHKPPPPLFPPQEQGRQGGGPYRFLVNALNLDSNQQNQYSKLRDEHHQAMERLQDQNRNLHERLYDLLSSSKDTATAKQFADSIAENQKQIELITFRHFQKVRAICNPDQQKKFDEVINEAMRMMGPQQPPPPPNDGPSERAHIGPPPQQDGNQPPPPPNN